MDPSVDRANDYRTAVQTCLDNRLCPGITVCKSPSPAQSACTTGSLIVRLLHVRAILRPHLLDPQSDSRLGCRYALRCQLPPQAGLRGHEGGSGCSVDEPSATFSRRLLRSNARRAGRTGHHIVSYRIVSSSSDLLSKHFVRTVYLPAVIY
jgi:hypothetical protein